MTTVKNDYSLLRPFDLEAAKAGEPICWFDNAEHVKFMLCSGDDGEHCVRMEDGNLALACFCDIRMSPLAWVEGKPVYKGDVLYSSFFAMSDDKCGKDNCGGKFVVSGITNQDYLVSEVRGENANTNISSCTWNPPKVKREGWINIYQYDNIFLRPTKEDADLCAKPGRIACVHIEWEEEAK